MARMAAELESCYDALKGTPQRGPRTPAASTASAKKRCADRFIPNRSAMDLNVSHFELTRDADHENTDVNASPAKEEYKKKLAANLFDGAPPPRPSTPRAVGRRACLRRCLRR